MEPWESLITRLAADEGDELCADARLVHNRIEREAPVEDVDDALDTVIRGLRSRDRLNEAELLAQGIREWVPDRLMHLVRIYRRRIELDLPRALSTLNELASDAEEIDVDYQRASVLSMIGEASLQAGDPAAARALLEEAARVAGRGMATPLLQDYEDCRRVVVKVKELLKNVPDSSRHR